MVETMEKRKGKKKLSFYFLILALAGYVIKNFFVGADTDEAYGIYVGYRLAMGDKLLLEMWEPHQTSAIFTALFIKPFLWITGGNLDFLNLYLRVVYFAVHGLITMLLYHTLRKCFSKLEWKSALGLALVYFVSSPKSVFVPEYSNLNVWFFALLCICLMWYYSEESPLKGKSIVLIGAGFALTCDVLAYPSMVILFPVCIFLLARKRLQNGWKQCLVFAIPCIASAAVFMGYVLTYISFDRILKVLPHIMSDGSHQTGISGKLQLWLQDLADMGIMFLISVLIALTGAWLWKRIAGHKKPEGEQELFTTRFLVSFFVVQIGFQFYFWFTSLYNASYPQHTYLAVALLGIWCYYKSGKKEKTGFLIILLSLIHYLGVVLFSNWGPMQLFSYMVVGAVGGLLCWNSYFVEYGVKLKQRLQQILCGLLIISNVFGYCYLIIGGAESNAPIFEVSGYCRDGFRKGILTGYMTAYRYNTNQEIWAEAIPEDCNLLYIGPAQFFGMFGDNTIACHNTISTPVYDENLLAYWEMNPDRYPDVVAVESWFGDIRYVGEDSFIMQWLENEFCATEVIDYSYIRVYKK